MLRKSLFVVCAGALTLAACGHQVTPNRAGQTTSGLSPGQIEFKFTTVGQLDFTNIQYVLAFNTSGTGGTPYATYGNTLNNWRDYNFLIVVSGNGSGGAQAQLYQLINESGVGGGGTIKVPYPSPPLGFPYTSQQVQLNQNCNGLGTQFCITVDRTIFNGINTFGTPSPSPSGSPTSSPSPGATPSPSPSPSATPSATASPSTFANIWQINWFTAQPTAATSNLPYGTVIDAPGVQGPLDTAWVFPHTVDITTDFDFQFTAQAGWYTNGIPTSAQIAGGEVLNNHLPPTPSP